MFSHLLRVAWQALGRRPAFTAIALVGIALSLGLVLTVAALLNATFGAHPPDAHGARTLGVYHVKFTNGEFTSSSPPGYRFLDLTTRDLPGVADQTVYTLQSKRATFQTGVRQDVWFKRVDAAFWRVMQFHFREGRPFSEEDDRTAQRVAVIGAHTAEKFFQGSALGHTLRLGPETYRVIGVVDDVSFLRAAPFSEVWVPLGTMLTSDERRRLQGNLGTLVVLDDDAKIADVQRAFQQRLSRVPVGEVNHATRVEAGLYTLFDSVMAGLFDGGKTDVALALLLLTALGVLFLSIPALNLINLNLSRTLERASEIGVRKAFGATPKALTGLFLVEHTLLCVIGSALGLVVAFVLLAVLSKVSVMPYTRFTPNLTLFGVALAAALVLSLLSGAYPAWRMARLHPVDALRRR